MKKLLFFLFLFTAISCGDSDLDNAKASLNGTWVVNRISTQLANGNNQEETGNLGSFVFSPSSLTYNFTKGGIGLNGQTAWTLTRDLVNSGFVKVERYTLDFESMRFICAFGDETSDAEKNARSIRLSGKGADGLSYQMWLSKP